MANTIKKSIFEDMPVPKLIVNVNGKWQVFTQVSSIKIDYSKTEREDILRHLKGLGRAFYQRQKRADTLLSILHSEYTSFRALYWVLIGVFISSIIATLTIVINHNINFLTFILILAIPIMFTLIPLFYVVKHKENIRKKLMWYLERHYLEHPINETLFEIWAHEHSTECSEKEPIIYGDETSKLLEKEITDCITYLVKTGKLEDEKERQIIQDTLEILPSHALTILSLEIEKALLDENKQMKSKSL